MTLTNFVLTICNWCRVDVWCLFNPWLVSGLFYRFIPNWNCICGTFYYLIINNASTKVHTLQPVVVMDPLFWHYTQMVLLTKNRDIDSDSNTQDLSLNFKSTPVLVLIIVCMVIFKVPSLLLSLANLIDVSCQHLEDSPTPLTLPSPWGMVQLLHPPTSPFVQSMGWFYALAG